jgi:protein-tyrosine phosphatase
MSDQFYLTSYDLSNLFEIGFDKKKVFFVSSCPGIPIDSLDKSLKTIKDLGVKKIYNFLTKEELEKLKLQIYSKKIKNSKLEYTIFPIQDRSVPDANKRVLFSNIINEMFLLINKEKFLLIHCHAGLGRSGLVSAILLKKFGLDSQQAIKLIRTKRPGSIETEEQEKFINEYNFK